MSIFCGLRQYKVILSDFMSQDNDLLNVQALFDKDFRKEDSSEVRNEIVRPSSMMAKAQIMASSNVGPTVDLNLGQDTPFTGRDMSDYLQENEVKTGEICAALAISANRWSTLTKISRDAKDMKDEYISPTLEIFFRLLKAYPEYVPWKKPTPQDVMAITGMSIEELASCTGSTEAAGKRWLEGNNVPTAQVTQLLTLMYRMAQAGVSPRAFAKVRDKVEHARNSEKTTTLVGQTWNSGSEKVFKKVRKIFRKAVNDLELDGNKKLKDTESADIMYDLLTSGEKPLRTMLAGFKSRSKVSDKDALTNYIIIIKACIRWTRLRNEHQKELVKYNRLKNKYETLGDSERDQELKANLPPLDDQKELLLQLAEELDENTIELERVTKTKIKNLD